jgi:Mce-associated membrane protein
VAATRTVEPVTPLTPPPSSPPPTTPARRRPDGRTLALAGLLLAALLCALAIVLTLPRLSDASEAESRRTDVLQAARQQAVNFTTLDYRRLDRDLGRVLGGATGQFRAQFRAGTTDLKELVTANKAVSDGEVLEAGIVTDDADSARVLVFADSTVTNSGDPKPQKRHYRMQMDLVLKDGRWLVSDLQFVG